MVCAPVEDTSLSQEWFLYATVMPQRVLYIVLWNGSTYHGTMLWPWRTVFSFYIIQTMPCLRVESAWHHHHSKLSSLRCHRPSSSLSLLWNMNGGREWKVGIGMLLAWLSIYSTPYHLDHRRTTERMKRGKEGHNEPERERNERK